ncbi:ElyC/SanA/YdcF family protein [Haemophilus pittmaniae]|uniref:SanA/YdcF family protein n=1 Tax=Haemophilus pittmaniae TaxID=249188 RepID=UPI0028DCF921|nr:ElyC/SanA/YdcF family protein [Haemophilus pittmaniae]
MQTAKTLPKTIRYLQKTFSWTCNHARCLLTLGGAIIIGCAAIDFTVGWLVRDAIYEDPQKVPYRPYGLVLGTAKYVAKGRTNDYYTTRVEAAKQLLDLHKVDYLLLSGDNRTREYNEPRTMWRDFKKMGVPDEKMFPDFAGFRTLDSVVRANKVFQVPAFTIISQRFHCERALLIAKYYDIDAVCFVAKQPEIYFVTRLRETFARVKAVIDLLIGVEPYFLGAPEPLPQPDEIDNKEDIKNS